MSGLLRRLTRRPAATADETSPEVSEPDAAAAAPADAGGEPPLPSDQVAAWSGQGLSDRAADSDEPPTQVIPGVAERGAAGEPPATTVGPPDVTNAPPATPVQAPDVTDAPPPTPVQPPDIPGEPSGTPVRPPDVPGEPPVPGAMAPQVLGEVPATTLQPAAVEVDPAAGDMVEVPAGPTPGRDLPAGVDLGELQAAPVPSARRGRLRRRLRYLRRVRELLLRDLGGFTYEVHRTAGGAVHESHRRLVEAKASRLALLDAELTELEVRLAEAHVQPVLREPGVGGTCPVCGDLHSSDAHYCARCGNPLDAKAEAERDAALAAAAQPITASHDTAEPAPASVLWAAGPRPRAEAEPEPDGAATSTVVAGETLAGSDETTTETPADEPEPHGSFEPDRPSAGHDWATDEPVADGDDDRPVEADAVTASDVNDSPTLDTPVGDTDDNDPPTPDTPAGDTDDNDSAVTDTPPDDPGEERPRRSGEPVGEPAGAGEAPAGGSGDDRPRDEDAAPSITSGDPLGWQEPRP